MSLNGPNFLNAGQSPSSRLHRRELQRDYSDRRGKPERGPDQQFHRGLRRRRPRATWTLRHQFSVPKYLASDMQN